MLIITLIAFGILISVAFHLAVALAVIQRIGWNREIIKGMPKKVGVLTSMESSCANFVSGRYPACNLPISHHSMRFKNLHTISCLLDKYRPRQIIEFGSGLTTLLIGSWLNEQNTGQLISIDHSEEWATATREALKQHALTERVRLITTPLKSISDESDDKWYDLPNDIFEDNVFDLIVVDGPPAELAANLQSRLPSVPTLINQIHSKTVIILDDAERTGEQEIIRTWEKLLPAHRLWVHEGLSNLAVFEPDSAKKP